MTGNSCLVHMKRVVTSPSAQMELPCRGNEHRQHAWASHIAFYTRERESSWKRLADQRQVGSSQQYFGLQPSDIVEPVDECVTTSNHWPLVAGYVSGATQCYIDSRCSSRVENELVRAVLLLKLWYYCYYYYYYCYYRKSISNAPCLGTLHVQRHYTKYLRIKKENVTVLTRVH